MRKSALAKHKVCPSCYSKRMRERDYYRYKEQKRRRYLCLDCGFLTAFPLRRKPIVRRKRKETKRAG